MCLEVWMWVRQKYEIIWIKILYSVESNNCTYVTVHDNGGRIDKTMQLMTYNAQMV